jgi:hypothetical protein
MRRLRTLLCAPLGLLVGVACSGDGTGPDPSDVRDFIVSLETSTGIEATFHAGSPPAGGGPVITVTTGTSALITGGSAIRTVSSATPFTTIVLAVSGFDGYWEITLPAPTTAAEVIMTLSQTILLSNFTLSYGAGSGGGFGYFAEPVGILVVGTGDVQVSVTWDTSADVDLHVVDPFLEEIYWGRHTSSSGGRLDLDSNAACSGDNVRNENITWSTAPPNGTYTVRVNYWANCGAAATNWVVTVRRKNQPPLTFSGQLTGAGTGGGLGAGQVVTTFDY